MDRKGDDVRGRGVSDGGIWHWIQAPDYGGQDGSAVSKVFKGKDGLSTEELLAREVIQNSWDAARVLQRTYPDLDIPFSVEFVFRTFEGRDKKALIKAAGLSALAERMTALPKGEAYVTDSVLNHLDDDEPVTVLYLVDRGSHGLFGDPLKEKGKSHLFKALYYMGGTGKSSVGAAQGGSYGFGKSAFIRASRTNTVFAHSCFEERDTDPATRRLVGFTWWEGHEIGPDFFEGRAIFGDVKAGQTVPFIDDEADSMAESLGMPLRDLELYADMGTTFMLLDPVVDPGELCAAIEKYWWPALEGSLMDITVIQDDGSELVPRPGKRPDLKPFIDAYRLALGQDVVIDPTRQRVPSSKWRTVREEGVTIGDLALVASDEDPELLMEGSPRVALIRSPRMVIEYKSFGGSNLPLFGTYVADDSADEWLRKTEPAAHDIWDVKLSPDIDPKATKIAKGVLHRIRAAVNEFAKDFAPPPVKEGRRLNLMADILSKFMRNKPIVPPPHTEPITIHFVEDEAMHAAADGQVYVTAGIQIALAPESKQTPMAVVFHCDVRISEDEALGGTPWPVSVTTVGEGNAPFTRLANGSWQGRLEGDQVVMFSIVSDAFDPSWTAVIRPTVSRTAEEGAA